AWSRPETSWKKSVRLRWRTSTSAISSSVSYRQHSKLELKWLSGTICTSAHFPRPPSSNCFPKNAITLAPSYPKCAIAQYFKCRTLSFFARLDPHLPVLQWSMARGWESKGIEEQQAEHSGSAPAAEPRRNLAEVTRTRQKDDLELRRQHVLQQLEVVRNARHQQLLKET